jgi:hypothetical protein
MRDFQRYEHMKPFDAIGCRVFSDSPEDLPSRREDLLSNREQLRRALRAGGRRAGHRAPGRAPRRTVSVLGSRMAVSA